VTNLCRYYKAGIGAGGGQAALDVTVALAARCGRAGQRGPDDTVVEARHSFDNLMEATIVYWRV